MTLREEFEKEVNKPDGTVDDIMSFLINSNLTKYAKWLEDKLNESVTRKKYMNGYNEGYNNAITEIMESMKDIADENKRIINS